MFPYMAKSYTQHLVLNHCKLQMPDLCPVYSSLEKMNEIY